MGAPEGSVEMTTLADVKSCLSEDPTPAPPKFTDAVIEMWQDGDMKIFRTPAGTAWMEMVAK
jgi:hypothetical protein